MNIIYNYFFKNNKSVKPESFTLQVSRDSLPSSPKWLNKDINYENIDGQPDEELSAEKQNIFNRKMKKLLQKPKETYSFLLYQKKYGSISSYLELYVLMKQEKLFIIHPPKK